MANTSSARKAQRQSIRRRVVNLVKKSRVRRLTKEFQALVSNPPTGEAGKETKQALPTGRQAQELLSQAYKAIDKAAKTGILKKNAAARKKSRLARLLASTRS